MRFSGRAAECACPGLRRGKAFPPYIASPPVRPRGPLARYFSRNANRSELIVSASVVGMPCGKPL